MKASFLTMVLFGLLVLALRSAGTGIRPPLRSVLGRSVAFRRRSLMRFN